MYELELAVICALGLWLLGRFARMVHGVAMATRWGRRRRIRRITEGYAGLYTPEGEEALQRFVREVAEDFSAAVDASGISKRL